MHSLRSHEGVILVDHRYSPGVPDEVMLKNGFPPGAGHGVFESATFTCRHCEKVVVVLSRQKADAFCGYCKGCNHRLCKRCTTLYAHDHTCRDMKAYAERLFNHLAKVSPSETFQSPVILLP